MVDYERGRIVGWVEPAKPNESWKSLNPENPDSDNYYSILPN